MIFSSEGELVLEGATDIDRMRRAALYFLENANVVLVEQSENVAENIAIECGLILDKFEAGEFDESVQSHQLRHYFDEVHSMFAETIINFAAIGHTDESGRRDLEDMLSTIHLSRDLDPEF